MTQDETDRLLRPRVTSQATAIPVTASDPVAASLLPETSSVAAASSIPRRRLILKCLLFGGAIYTSLLLFWSVTHLNTADGSDAHTTFQSAVNTVVSEAKELQLMRTEFLLTTTGSAKDEIATLVPPVREEKPTEQPEESPANDQASELDPKDAITQAEEHARVVKMLPADEKVKRRLKCIGWRATSHCSPHGPREPENDKGCYNVVPNSMSGYCEVEDEDTGELFRVMKRYCASLRFDATFRCTEAPDFVKYQVESIEAADKALAPDFTLPNVLDAASSSPRDGIVIVVYPKLIASAYATLRALRTVLGCHLPIEVWFREQEIRVGSEALSPLLKLANSTEGGDISFHKIDDQWATGFGAKVHAVYSSHFERVLFLDADNVPTRDPTYLF
ncbi:hypothetical protein DVH05_015829 [Phytophthora capsici]|nr:hypothetical protein DVH05_015829 [Phytophthora capsici]